MKKLSKVKPNLKIIKESASRSSLTIVLGVFVFLILLSAIGLAAVALYVWAKFGILVYVNGELHIGSIILFMSVISLVIGGALAFASSRFTLRPINTLINMMNRLAAGDFKARLKFGNILSTHSAFREITESFNTMAEELENTELLRSDFINNFSHEFKTPIVSISGFAKLLSNENLSEEQRKQYLKSIEEESLRLSSMATNVLKLTKIENQHILTDISKFNLSEQIRGAVLLLESKWEEKEIELGLNFEEFFIEANEELTKEIWINLIDNAIKFANHGGKVSLSVKEKGKYLCVEVSNSGSMIPADKIEKIYNKFYQADESHDTKGNGIGLAIVKKIVDLHGGTINARSESEKTTFEVCLPVKQ